MVNLGDYYFYNLGFLFFKEYIPDLPGFYILNPIINLIGFYLEKFGFKFLGFKITYSVQKESFLLRDVVEYHYQ